VVAGCGSSSSSSTHSASPKPASGSPQQSYAPYAASTTPTSTQVALVTTKHGKLGTILAFGPKKMTVYLFEKDAAGTSSCTGACATAWPPVTGKPQAGAGAIASDLGTITRSDGSTQVTYKGHPLYRFVKDKDGGDAYGEGVKAFGAGWYALAPSGKKVDRS
jgi:predicted lipoprotein with Yx(FWY)xxD motif